MIAQGSFVMLMGGLHLNKKMCEKLGALEALKRYNDIMVEFSLMSKYVIITPCSEEYPDFNIEEGLNFDGISIYLQNNTFEEIYPDTFVGGDET